MRAILTALAVALVLAGAARAEGPADKGRAIAIEADWRNRGWGDQGADLEMILRDRQGQESLRRLRVRTLEVDGDGDKSLIIFDEPRDVAGTALLSHTHATRPDDQWLYLPALRRVKRISSANKSGPFMGSEFAYEDLTSQEVEKYRYRWLRDELLDGHECFVVERYPAYEHSGYARQVTWIDKEMYQPLKVEYYDRRDALLKTLRVYEYRRYLERYWRAGRMEMVNQQSGKSTTLHWSGYRFGTGLGARDFERSVLRRVR